jgi:hypothetical protein
LKDATHNASKAIDSLMNMEKKNTTLRSELSQSLERCKSQAIKSKEMICILEKKLRESRAVSSKWQKRWTRAIKSKENAVQKAKAKIVGERSIHRLLHKGTYTEETRNLIQLLVKAGCSQAYVSEVIHAVFKTAGISVIGNVSRTSVSRFIMEGFYAAQMQLGYEMKDAKSMHFLYVAL